jgi:hypothetical protein
MPSLLLWRQTGRQVGADPSFSPGVYETSSINTAANHSPSGLKDLQFAWSLIKMQSGIRTALPEPLAFHMKATLRPRYLIDQAGEVSRTIERQRSDHE